MAATAAVGDTSDASQVLALKGFPAGRLEFGPSAKIIRFYIMLYFFAEPRANVDTRQRLRETRGRQHRRRGTQLARILGLGLPAPLLGAPSSPEFGPLRQIGEARENEFCRCCPCGKCLARASDQAGLEARPKPIRAGATEITENGAAGKIYDFKVVGDTGVGQVASARPRMA